MLLPSRYCNIFLVLELLNAVFLVFLFYFLVCFIFNHPESLLLLLKPSQFVCLFCFTSQVNSYGHGGMVS